ncbi:MAG: porin family protein [Bacteroidales bacterium]
MRRNSIILILVLSFSTIYAQADKPRNLPGFDYKKLHWGFTVGLNSMDYAIRRNQEQPGFLYADVHGFQPAGFQVNIVSDLRLDDNWNLRFLPGINLGSRNLVFFDPDTWELDNSMTIGSSYLDFPLLVKYRSERVNNYRPYLISGMSYRIDMSAQREFNQDEGGRIHTKSGDIYLEVGFGIDNYLQYFKYSTEIKLAMGLRNMMVTTDPLSGVEQYSGSISGLRSFLVMLNFHFE